MDELALSDYWRKHYVNRGHYSLCGNSGVIHTEGTRTPAGLLVGRANYCICPNGVSLRKYNINGVYENDDSMYLAKGYDHAL